MATIVRGAEDQTVLELKSALEDYEHQVAGAEASIYRQNPGSIRVRIIDDHVAGVPRSRRHEQVWQFLAERAGDDAMSEVSMLLVLPRAEMRSSLANLEFEDPVPSNT